MAEQKPIQVQVDVDGAVQGRNGRSKMAQIDIWYAGGPLSWVVLQAINTRGFATNGGLEFYRVEHFDELCRHWLAARGYTVLEPNPEGGWSYERRQAALHAMAEFCDNCQERHLCHDVADCDFVARTDEDAPRPVTASEDHGDDPAASHEDRVGLSATPELCREGPGVAGAPQGYCNLHDGPCLTCPRDKTRLCPSPF